MYKYDALYRLVVATGRELTSLQLPTHDDFANNIAVPNTASNAMQNYIQEYTYDAHGNITRMPHLTSMDWDYKNQLLGATNGTFSSYYVYDSSGNRVRKVVVKGNVVEERYYLGNYEVYRKTNNGTLEVERSTVHVSDDQKRIAQIDDDGATETIRYQYDNHLGSASLELDQNAAIISYEEYHPFGTTSYRSGRTETEVSLKRYKYVGKERDEETGLYYYGARYYAAWIGRWTAVDPLKEKYLHLSPYSYVANNPMKFIDPDGRKIVWADDENTKNTRVKVNELVQKSMIFATLYNYLDNLPKEINVSTNDEILQEKYQKATEGKDPTTKVGGVTSPDGREIIFSEITSKNNAYVEEFLHSFQTNFYKEPRNSQEKDAEAKLLNTVVAVEIEQNEIKSKGKQKVIDATKIFFSPGLISYNGVFALLIEEASKTGLIVKQGTVAALEYFKYLKVFEKEKEGTVYEGKQREVLPEAYNKIIELTK